MGALNIAELTKMLKQIKKEKMKPNDTRNTKNNVETNVIKKKSLYKKLSKLPPTNNRYHLKKVQAFLNI